VELSRSDNSGTFALGGIDPFQLNGRTSTCSVWTQGPCPSLDRSRYSVLACSGLV